MYSLILNSTRILPSQRLLTYVQQPEEKCQKEITVL